MRIGIIGGGQLGMMMAESVKEYDVEVIGLDPNPDCSLSYVAEGMIIGDYNDEASFEKLAKRVDMITYEFENVDLELINKYKNLIPQKSAALQYSRNRLTEKNYVSKLGIPTVKYELLTGDYVYRYPVIVKTTTGGYDGKGQQRIRQQSDIDHNRFSEDIEYIVEEFIEFDYEISVILTRDTFGNVVSYPIPINNHVNGILFTSLVTNEINKVIKGKAIDYSTRIIEALDYVGTMAVEFFIREEEVIFNEFAPRPHNSGHYTIEGCNLSQFENHMRAIMGEEIKDVKLINPTIMINVLGQNMDYTKGVSNDDVYIHMYQKKECLTNRKMGHITVVKADENDLKNIMREIIGE